MKTATPSCNLCGLPLPAKPTVYQLPEASYRFCCGGCKQVFIMLMNASDDSDPATFKDSDLYQKCLEMGIIPRTEAELARRLADAAQPAFSPAPEARRQTDAPAESNTLSLVLKIDNMWCPACAWIINETLAKTDGIRGSDCSFSTDRLRCEYDPVKTSPQNIIRVLEKLGYDTAPDDGAESGTQRKEFIRFALSAFLTMNVMMLSFALYSGFFTEISADTIGKLSWPIAILATVVLLYGGRPIYRKAFGGIGTAAFGMETLIAAGSFSAYLYSSFNLLAGSIHLYYDTASMLITLVLLGKMLERKAKDRVRIDVESFFSLSPKKVKICSTLYPQGRYANTDQLKAGDVFQVTENEILPADGRIVAGSGLLDESTLTGEPLPLEVKPGDPVKSGTSVLSGTLRIEAEQVGPDSILGQMTRILQQSLGDQTPLEGKTDRLLKWFVPSILLLAAGTGVVVWAIGLSAEAAIVRAVTVMVISCPCALGVAIPLARVAGISVAGKKGLLVRTFSGFETAPQIDTVVFDKTGTVTQGRWTLLDIQTFSPFDEVQLLSTAAALEAGSHHPIASEINRQAEEKQIEPAEVQNIRTFENGIMGTFQGAVIKFGSADFLAEERRLSADVLPERANADHAVYSPVYMSIDGRVCGAFTFGDRIKPSAEKAVTALKGLGLKPHLISGDNTATSRSVADGIGIDRAAGGMLPQDKAAYVASLQKQGHRVAMIGDGINDAPALLQADLSLAVFSGSHLSNEAAHVTLMRSDPVQVYDFLNFAGKVNRKVFQNLLFSFCYNAVSIPVAMSGLLTPLVAVCAMLLSSLSVIGNTLLLIRRSA